MTAIEGEAEELRAMVNSLSGSELLTDYGREVLIRAAIKIEQQETDLEKLYWFFMMENGGSDGSDLDTAVYEDALAVASRLNFALQPTTDEASE